MRLVDADAYIEKNECCGYLDEISVKKFNEITPTVDAVKVVRCKDCALCDVHIHKCFDGTEDTWYICGYRKTYCLDGDGYCNHGFRKAEKEKTDENLHRNSR